MHGNDSGQIRGTSGFPQTTLEQLEYEQLVEQIEHKAVEHRRYIEKELPKSAPLHIPSTAYIKEEIKNGYDQIKYIWKRGQYKYLGRWHTRTPNAPLEQRDTWVIERKRPGIGNGLNARPAKTDILVGKSKSGNNIWVSKKKWYDAINARKNGTVTKEQEELLKNGHWKA